MAEDNVVLAQYGYGRTDGADGRVWPWVFNAASHYWSQIAVKLKFMAEIEGGIDKMAGKKIVHLHIDSAYGREPLPAMRKICEDWGVELIEISIPPPGLEQQSQWLQIRRERPDYIFMWGWGVMNQVAIKQASSIKFPMENFIGIWWSGSEHDVMPAGAGAHGYKALTFNAPGDDYQVHKDIKKYVHDKGQASGDGSHFGTVLYNRGLFQAMVQVEAARVAQKIHGTSKITPAMYRDGMENVDLNAKRMEELGFKNFAPPFKNSCENHGGSGLAAVQQWDAKAKKWNMITEYMYGDSEVVDKLIAEDSTKYAKEQKIAMRCN